jgi:hypothetical protein
MLTDEGNKLLTEAVKYIQADTWTSSCVACTFHGLPQAFVFCVPCARRLGQKQDGSGPTGDPLPIKRVGVMTPCR